MTGYVLDAGALIAYERRDRTAWLLVQRALEQKERLTVPAGVVGQVWRDGSRQALLARLLATGTLEVVALDDGQARAAGALCGATGTTDVIDASVVVCGRVRHAAIVTSDPVDIRRLDPTAELVLV